MDNPEGRGALIGNAGDTSEGSFPFRVTVGCSQLITAILNSQHYECFADFV